MNYQRLLVFYIIWCAASSLSSQSSSSADELHTLQKHQHHINHNASLENRSNGMTGPWSWKQHQYYKHRALRTVHGSVNIMGWGVLFPIGVIIARYFRESAKEWYNLHILTQLSGFLVGTLGWGLGISIKNEAKQQKMSTHGILGTMIFAFATVQLVGVCLQQSCRYWVIYHNVVGYALILLIIANIFQGISNHSVSKRWDLFYAAVLGILGLTALALQLLRWKYA